MPPTYDYLCSNCNHITLAHYKLSETRPEVLPCEACESQANYKIATPMVLKASYLDGQRSKGWKDLKEASKLNKTAAATDNLQEKKEIQKEAGKIGYSFNKDPT